MQKENKVYDVMPATRMDSVQEYYFSKKLKEVAAMNAAGMRVISLGVGSPDLPPSEASSMTTSRTVRTRPRVYTRRNSSPIRPNST